MTAALRAERLSVRYGGVRALQGVDVEVAPGELVGLIGPNGAGKTTLIDAITGFARCEGRVLLGERDLTGTPPAQRSRHGLARTWQAGELFDDLTVGENVVVAAGPQGWRATAREILSGRVPGGRLATGPLAAVGLEELGELEARELTQGQRKLAGIARALAGSPSIVCLDEPAAGLDTDESMELGLRLRAIAEQGTGMLLIDHDMGLVLSVCDRIVVLDFGEVIASGAPSEIRHDPTVIAAYLGHAGGEPAPAVSGAPA